MESEIISKENIKPSSPTPPHLKTYNLSLLDQIVPPIFVPLVLYFPAPENASRNASSDPFISQTIQILKQSLSSTLTRYYPLAGRIKDNFSIDCNDEGVPFVVTKFKGNLSDFLKNPDPAECRSHIPCVLSWTEPGPGTHIATIQVNYFACGGIAIGSLFLHKGFEETGDPNYLPESIFPQNRSMKRESHLFSAMRKYFKFGKTVMRRYVFNSSAVSTLRTKVTEQEGLQFRPSRVELVSALVWKCFMVALSETTIKSGIQFQPESLVTHGVNMRRKANPALPNNSFGNYVWLVPASSRNETDMNLKPLACKVRNAIKKIDSDFVKSMQGEEGFSGYLENLEDAWSGFPDNAEYLAISSWCNFGLYGVDFGWGKPVWITKCDAGSEVDWPFINIVWLMDTREGDGIEAWVTLDEHCIEAFDNIEELKNLASIDPSPLETEMSTEKIKELKKSSIESSPLETAAASRVLVNGVS
ncbi:hypothetical protein ACJIZ3_002794 [Penstemon smallii]|uniref:Uncharacterized protein n=1 Tax=Penstemon smallii TaxID=265156 RepID=A0ABD3U7H2_9LAMI